MGNEPRTAADANLLTQKLHALSNDILQVEDLSPDLIEFRHSSENKSFLGTRKKTFLARAKVEAEKGKVNYWQTVEEAGAGLSFSSGASSSSTKGSNMVKFSGFVVKGVDRSGDGAGFQPDGAKFKYDLSIVRDLVKAASKEAGWDFGDAWMKPN